MRRIVSLLSFILFGTTVYYAQVGVNTDSPQASLDISAKTTDGSKPEGVLAPRLTGNQIQLADGQYNTAQRGMIIYATNATTAPAGKTINITAEGYYYFDGSVWQKMGIGAYAGSASVALNGNSFQRAALTGDATAAANSNTTTVVGLLGRPLDTTPPQPEYILSYNGTSWIPKSLTEQSIPRQIVSVSVSGTQYFSGGPGGSAYDIIIAFPTKNFDSYNSWDTSTNTFTVPIDLSGTYTVDMMLSNERGVYSSGSYWVMAKLQKSTNNGVTWVDIIRDINSLDSGFADNGNSLFWSGNLNAGDKLRVFGQCYGTNEPYTIYNTIKLGNLAITKL